MGPLKTSILPWRRKPWASPDWEAIAKAEGRPFQRSNGTVTFPPTTTMGSLLASGFAERIRLVERGWRVCPSCRALCFPRLIPHDEPHVCDPKRRWNGGFEACVPLPFPPDGYREHLIDRLDKWASLTIDWPRTHGHDGV